MTFFCEQSLIVGIPGQLFDLEIPGRGTYDDREIPERPRRRTFCREKLWNDRDIPPYGREIRWNNLKFNVKKTCVREIPKWPWKSAKVVVSHPQKRGDFRMQIAAFFDNAQLLMWQRLLAYLYPTSRLQKAMSIQVTENGVEQMVSKAHQSASGHITMHQLCFALQTCIHMHIHLWTSWSGMRTS